VAARFPLPARRAQAQPAPAPDPAGAALPAALGPRALPGQAR